MLISLTLSTPWSSPALNMTTPNFPGHHQAGRAVRDDSGMGMLTKRPAVLLRRSMSTASVEEAERGHEVGEVDRTPIVVAS